ncbi:MAG: hypothetical protein ACRESV_08800 [Nevskiales bacterium]
MRWICPGCGSQVSVALSQCPNCGSTENRPLPPPPSPAIPATAPTPAAVPHPAPALPVSQAPRQLLLPVPPSTTDQEGDRESAFWWGMKFAVGFMVAVAMILLLLALLLPWLREQGWQPWLDSSSP